jgi:hypothetical protein
MLRETNAGKGTAAVKQRGRIADCAAASRWAETVRLGLPLPVAGDFQGRKVL